MIAETIVEATPSITQADQRESVISVRNVGKMYRIYDKPQDRLKQMLLWRFGKNYGHEFWALRNVSFDIKKGETVGIIGRNGSGKSTLLQMIAGTLTPTEGEVVVNGRIAALLELGSGFNPEFTGRENVFLNGAILGLSRAEMEMRFQEIEAFADIGEFINQPVKVYSSGMVVRLAFAVASCIEPEILIVDEALAVGDIAFQARCLEKIKRLTSLGTTTLFVTHDTGTFQNLCDYGYLLDYGRLFAQGRPSQVALQYYELIRETEHARQRLAASPPEQAAEVRAELAQKADEIRGKAAEGEYRFGTGAARITGYRVTNAMGHETATLAVGEAFCISIEIEFEGQVSNLSVGIMFRNAQGQNLMGMHSYHENRYSFGPHGSGEKLVVLCEQIMLLNPGDYLLNIGLADCRSDYDFTNLDSRNSLAKITVFGKAISYGLVHTQPHFYWRSNQQTYSLSEIVDIYENESIKPGIDKIINIILKQTEQPIIDDGIEKEERAWPGEPRFVQTGYYRRMLGRYLFAGSQFCRGARILETCCGLGWGTYIIAQYADQVTAFDIDVSAIEQCKDMWPVTNVRWLSGDARQLDFLGTDQYDVALGMEAIEHLTYRDGVLYIKEVASHLRSGGVFIGTSAFPELKSEAQEMERTNPYHLHIWTRTAMLELLHLYFSRAVIIGNWMFIAVK